MIFISLWHYFKVCLFFITPNKLSVDVLYTVAGIKDTQKNYNKKK